MPSLSLLLLLLAVLVGAMVPVQYGSNAVLARFAGHPLFAAAVNTAVATLVLVVVIVALRLPAPTFRASLNSPWWSWLGGLYGATLVASAIVIAPRLGATAYVAASIVGTMGMSLAIDHFGLLDFQQQPLSAQRLLGAVLVVAGMLLVARR